jgi:hypothetical protein
MLWIPDTLSEYFKLLIIKHKTFTDIIKNNYRKVTFNIVTASAFLKHEE